MKRIWAALGAVLLLAGCSPIIVLEPAADANNPDCASVVVRLPELVADLPQRQTDAQSTSAWGDPESVIFTCGVTVPGASTLPCFEKQGIFWLRDESNETYWTFRTFGRDPAVEVAVDRDIASGPGVVIDDLANAVSFLPTNGLTCTDLDDTVTGQDLGPLPTADPTAEPTTSPSPTPAG